jgi:SAM-dependent methyltransferase
VSVAPCLRGADGTALPLERERWLAPAAPVEERLLDRVLPPALDVGCGPGRLVLALAHRGIVALGVDAAPTAVVIASQRGAPVLRRSIFEPLPGAGRWGTALLLDGSVGIGGDPQALMLRLRQLLRPTGRVLVEVEPPGAPTGRTWFRVQNGSEISPSFPWGRVAADRLDRLAHRTGFVITELWTADLRWFGVLDRR